MSDRFCSNGTRICGFYGITDKVNDMATIWVDCTPEQVQIFIDALNAKVKEDCDVLSHQDLLKYIKDDSE